MTYLRNFSTSPPKGFSQQYILITLIPVMISSMTRIRRSVHSALFTLADTSEIFRCTVKSKKKKQVLKERFCWQSLQSRDWMVFNKGHIRPYLWIFWTARYWSVCIKAEPQGAKILFMATRSGSSLCRQPLIPLGQRVCLCVPTFCHIASDPTKDPIRTGRTQ